MLFIVRSQIEPRLRVSAPDHHSCKYCTFIHVCKPPGFTSGKLLVLRETVEIERDRHRRDPLVLHVHDDTSLIVGTQSVTHGRICSPRRLHSRTNCGFLQ